MVHTRESQVHWRWLVERHSRKSALLWSLDAVNFIFARQKSCTKKSIPLFLYALFLHNLLNQIWNVLAQKIPFKRRDSQLPLRRPITCILPKILRQRHNINVERVECFFNLFSRFAGMIWIILSEYVNTRIDDQPEFFGLQALDINILIFKLFKHEFWAL